MISVLTYTKQVINFWILCHMVVKMKSKFNITNCNIKGNMGKSKIKQIIVAMILNIFIQILYLYNFKFKYKLF